MRAPADPPELLSRGIKETTLPAPKIAKADPAMRIFPQGTAPQWADGGIQCIFRRIWRTMYQTQSTTSGVTMVASQALLTSFASATGPNK